MKGDVVNIVYDSVKPRGGSAGLKTQLLGCCTTVSNLCSVGFTKKDIK